MVTQTWFVCGYKIMCVWVCIKLAHIRINELKHSTCENKHIAFIMISLSCASNHEINKVIYINQVYKNMLHSIYRLHYFQNMLYTWIQQEKNRPQEFFHTVSIVNLMNQYDNNWSIFNLGIFPQCLRYFNKTNMCVCTIWLILK